MEDEPIFDWDEANIFHLARHGVTPQEAEEVITNHPLLLGVELRQGELRRQEFGESRLGRILLIVTTTRGYKIRVVTGWPCDRTLQRIWIGAKAKRPR